MSYLKFKWVSDFRPTLYLQPVAVQNNVWLKNIFNLFKNREKWPKNLHYWLLSLLRFVYEKTLREADSFTERQKTSRKDDYAIRQAVMQSPLVLIVKYVPIC